MPNPGFQNVIISGIQMFKMSNPGFWKRKNVRDPGFQKRGKSDIFKNMGFPKFRDFLRDAECHQKTVDSRAVQILSGRALDGTRSIGMAILAGPVLARNEMPECFQRQLGKLASCVP